MSGFVAILNTDSSPVEPEILEPIMTRLHYRGPDKQFSKIDSFVGFGQTVLCVTPEEIERPCPPLTLDDVTIVGNVRLDARSELVDQLKAAGQRAGAELADIELLLRAYLAWGTDLPNHLIGQFACALWDARQGCMLAFRDHFGQLALFYAKVKNSVIISNELTALRLHLAVSSTLNDQAIGDFLLFGSVIAIDKTLTAFADIQRLSGGYVLKASRAGDVKVQRCWTLPINQLMLRYRREEEYLEHFRSLLKLSVRDKMRVDEIVALMSGGLDSTSIAVFAQQLIRKGEVHAHLTAVTTIYEQLHPDTERHFAELVAQKIGIPIHFFVGDPYPLADPLPALSEPSETYESGFHDAVARFVWSYGRVTLYGEGADALLRYELLFDVLRRLPPTQALTTYFWLWRYLGQRPGLNGLSAALNPHNWGQPTLPQSYGYPAWIKPEFAFAMNLKERWEEGWAMRMTSDHRLHSLAYASLTTPDWVTEVEQLHPPMDSYPAFVVMPFLDLRLVNFMLALPPLPWFHKKYLIRQAMRDDLPQEVLQRAKTPLGTVLTSLLKQRSAQWVDHWSAVPELEAYLCRESIAPIYGDVAPAQAYVNIRPLLLNNWLKQMKSVLAIHL